MSDTPTSPSSGGAEKSLTHRTAAGFAWVTLAGVTGNGARLLGQLVLAWLLLKEDFGVYGLALPVMMFATLFQQAGIMEVLVHRQRSFRLWSNSALWLSGVFGLMGSTIMLLAAYPIAIAYESDQLLTIILILAITPPLQALAVVPNAKLRSELRFRALAIVGFGEAVTTAALAIAFAWQGFGPLSLALPIPIVALMRLSALSWVARPPVRRVPQHRRWRYMFRDAARIFGSNLAQWVAVYGDYLVLGLFVSKDAVGVYFVAYNLSAQTIRLVTVNLAGVLFPALARLRFESQRQTRAFLRATRVLALVGAPMCLLQAALADPVLRLVLEEEKWVSAIPVLQILSLGMALRLTMHPARSLIQAQGRFRFLLYFTAATSVMFLVLIAVGAALGGILGAAIAAGVYGGITGTSITYLAIRTTGGRWADLVDLMVRPLLISAVAVVPGYAMSQLVPAAVPARFWIQIALVLVTTAAIYIPLLRRTAPEEFREASSRLGLLVTPFVRSMVGRLPLSATKKSDR